MTQLLTVLLLSCAAPAAAQVQVSTHALTVEQAYKPANTRDPLVASTVYGDQKGTGEHKKAAASDTKGQSVEKGTFSVYGLKLTGIMEDSRGREALFRDAAGAVYTLKAGRLTDSKKKTVPGVSGIVKGKQVTLMTEDKKVLHLNLRENE
ncbi:MAG: pilus assembly protein PilP [Elusimicrobiales bacterium]|nr:pilus assembly protein PilP [Elusimicrobiales bacterium]